MIQIVINILLVVHVVASCLLLLVVLMQRPKSEGLGAAFGGGMADDLFGAQTTTVLTKTTVYLGVAFFVLTLTLSVLYASQSRQKSGLQLELAKPLSEEAATTSNAPSPQTAINQPNAEPNEAGSSAVEAVASDSAEPAQVVENALGDALANPPSAQDANASAKGENLEVTDTTNKSQDSASGNAPGEGNTSSTAEPVAAE